MMMADSNCLCTVRYLCSEANERHVGVTHCYQVSQLFVEGTHFSTSLRLLWLWVPLVPRYLQSNRDKKKIKLHIKGHVMCLLYPASYVRFF